MSDSNVIEVMDLTKWYPEVLAVDRISFEVTQGQVVGFLGPNGAGKTTTLKMLTCFMPPTSGQARVAGFDISRDPDGVRRSIGYLPENNALYEEMRVSEYLKFRASLKAVPWRLRGKYVDEAMEMCRLGEVRDRVVGHLSKGYRQRVGLADTLVHKPPVLIFDEPTVGLDPAQIIEVRGLIKRLARDNTVLLSTHYLAEVEQICDYVIVIHRGKVVAAETKDRLCTGPDGETVGLEAVFMKLISEVDAKAGKGSGAAKVEREAEVKEAKAEVKEAEAEAKEPEAEEKTEDEDGGDGGGGDGGEDAGGKEVSS